MPILALHHTLQGYNSNCSQQLGDSSLSQLPSVNPKNSKAYSRLAPYSAGLPVQLFPAVGKVLIISFTQSKPKNSEVSYSLASFFAGLKVQPFPAVGKALIISTPLVQARKTARSENSKANSRLAPYSAGLKVQLFPTVRKVLIISITQSRDWKTFILSEPQTEKLVRTSCSLIKT